MQGAAAKSVGKHHSMIMVVATASSRIRGSVDTSPCAFHSHNIVLVLVRNAMHCGIDTYSKKCRANAPSVLCRTGTEHPRRSSFVPSTPCQKTDSSSSTEYDWDGESLIRYDNYCVGIRIAPLTATATTTTTKKESHWNERESKRPSVKANEYSHDEQ